MRLSRCLPAVVLSAGLLAGLGCGPASSGNAKEVSGTKVRGTLLQNGKPVKFLPEESIRVSLSTGDGDGQIATTAEVNREDGAFLLEGPTGQGIPPGTYTAQVVGDVYGAETPDRFARLFDPEDEEAPRRRPLTVEIGGEEGQEIVVDVGKWKASKK